MKISNSVKTENFIPYSKTLLEYSRAECWIMTFVLFIMNALGMNTENLYQIALAGWTGYGVAKALYYNMAKSDHQIQLLKEIDTNADEKIKNTIAEDVANKLQENLSKVIENND